MKIITCLKGQRMKQCLLLFHRGPNGGKLMGWRKWIVLVRGTINLYAGSYMSGWLRPY